MAMASKNIVSAQPCLSPGSHPQEGLSEIRQSPHVIAESLTDRADQFASMNVAFAVSSAIGAIAGGQMYDTLTSGWAAVC